MDKDTQGYYVKHNLIPVSFLIICVCTLQPLYNTVAGIQSKNHVFPTMTKIYTVESL